MADPAARLLALLGLLQSRAAWTGPELAARLAVQERTVRKDVDRLRGLGYPVEATRGRGGGYRLGDHGRLPPLLLDDDEAVVTAVALVSASAVPGLADAGRSASAKVERILPERLRRRAHSLRQSTDVGPADTGTNVPDPEVDLAALTTVAQAIADHEGLRFFHEIAGTDEPARVEADPYRLVSWQQRWYVVARERPTGRWAAYRLDRMTLRTPGASRFVSEPLEGEDYAALVLRQVASTGWKVHARILVDAPAEEVLGRINPAVGVVETVDDTHSVLVTGADSLEVVAVWIGMLGLDFHVDRPADLVEHLRDLSERYARALPG